MSCAFEIVEPGQLAFAEALSEDECSIRKDGTLIAHLTAFEAVDVQAYCVVLADGATLRIALRAPRDPKERVELGRAVSPVLRRSKPTGRASVNVLRAIRRLGLTPEAVAGRYALSTKDDLLIVHLDQARSGDRQERT